MERILCRLPKGIWDYAVDHRGAVYRRASKRNSEGRSENTSQIHDSRIKNSCAREDEKW